MDPIISKFNIKNKWGYLLHLDRSWVSKCINNHKGFETHGELKKISEEYPEEVKKVLYDSFINGALKNVFSEEKLKSEKIYLCEVIEKDDNLYPGQKKYFKSISNLYEFYSKIIQFSLTVKKTFDISNNNVNSIYECLDKTIKFIISKEKIKNNLKVHRLSYTILDKCDKNNIIGRFREMIINSFDKYYFNLDEYFEDYINLDYAIYDKISIFYSNIYLEVLNDNKLNNNDMTNILDNSTYIFLCINEKIQNILFSNKILKTSYEDAKEYIMALSVYVFYKCKFLIPMEAENNDN